MDVDRNEKELRLAGMCGLGQLVIHSRGDEKAWSEQQRVHAHANICATHPWCPVMQKHNSFLLAFMALSA
eukprot:scaffold51944_cov17-Tisochrysis_lutea.AAC.1